MICLGLSMSSGGEGLTAEGLAAIRAHLREGTADTWRYFLHNTGQGREERNESGASAVDLRQSHQSLCDAIRRYGRDAREARQVADRLRTLLPRRLSQVRHGIPSQRTRSRTSRLALIDPTYVHHLQELADIIGSNVYARIQYESHLMLLAARRSLRRVKRS